MKFPVVDSLDKFPQSDIPTFVVIWTTTPRPAGKPGHLPASDFTYALVEAKAEGVGAHILAQDLLEHVAKEMELDDLKEITTFRGSDLEGPH